MILELTKTEIETICFCVTKMLEVNKLEHGEMCASILTGPYDRTEEFQQILTKLNLNNDTTHIHSTYH